jgi:Resolvase, N terminal domain
MKITGYVRVSTAEQVTEGMSLEAQENRIKAWADANDAEVVEIIRDEAVSGSKLLADRPGGKKVAKLLEARRPGVDAVVVLRRDRPVAMPANRSPSSSGSAPARSAWWPSPNTSTWPPSTGGPWPRSVRCSPSLSGP